MTAKSTTGSSMTVTKSTTGSTESHLAEALTKRPPSKTDDIEMKEEEKLEIDEKHEEVEEKQEEKKEVKEGEEEGRRRRRIGGVAAPGPSSGRQRTSATGR